MTTLHIKFWVLDNKWTALHKSKRTTWPLSIASVANTGDSGFFDRQTGKKWSCLSSSEFAPSPLLYPFFPRHWEVCHTMSKYTSFIQSIKEAGIQENVYTGTEKMIKGGLMNFNWKENCENSETEHNERGRMWNKFDKFDSWKQQGQEKKGEVAWL